MSYDVLYILCIIAFLFALFCSINVNFIFRKYNKVPSRGSMTAASVARLILDINGLQNVQIVQIAGELTDNYNPTTNVVSLSNSVYNSNSIAAIGVAAHECGHAIQHAVSYQPIVIRNKLFPLARIGSNLYIWVFILGLIFSFQPLINAGIILFTFCLLFEIVTLPTEFNASHRAIEVLRTQGILAEDELKGTKKVLRAAAMTYIASLAVSILQLLRLLALKNRN